MSCSQNRSDYIRKYLLGELVVIVFSGKWLLHGCDVCGYVCMSVYVLYVYVFVVCMWVCFVYVYMF